MKNVAINTFLNYDWSYSRSTLNVWRKSYFKYERIRSNRFSNHYFWQKNLRLFPTELWWIFLSVKRMQNVELSTLHCPSDWGQTKIDNFMSDCDSQMQRCPSVLVFTIDIFTFFNHQLIQSYNLRLSKLMMIQFSRGLLFQ